MYGFTSPSFSSCVSLRLAEYCPPTINRVPDLSDKAAPIHWFLFSITSITVEDLRMWFLLVPSIIALYSLTVVFAALTSASALTGGFLRLRPLLVYAANSVDDAMRTDAVLVSFCSLQNSGRQRQKTGQE